LLPLHTENWLKLPAVAAVDMALELIKWEPTLRGTPFHKQTLATVATGFVLSFVYLVSLPSNLS
jgi:hypothetical protein